MAPMLYSQLCLAGKYTLADLQTLRQWGSVVPGHPERDIDHGIENTSGPLTAAAARIRMLSAARFISFVVFISYIC